MTVGAEFYPMIKQMAAAGRRQRRRLRSRSARKNGDVLTENADGSGTCVTTIKEGELTHADRRQMAARAPTPAFTVVSPGVVQASPSRPTR
jgi:hypothetical protein